MDDRTILQELGRKRSLDSHRLDHAYQLMALNKWAEADAELDKILVQNPYDRDALDAKRVLSMQMRHSGRKPVEKKIKTNTKTKRKPKIKTDSKREGVSKSWLGVIMVVIVLVLAAILAVTGIKRHNDHVEEQTDQSRQSIVSRLQNEDKPTQ